LLPAEHVLQQSQSTLFPLDILEMFPALAAIAGCCLKAYLSLLPNPSWGAQCSSDLKTVKTAQSATLCVYGHLVCISPAVSELRLSLAMAAAVIGAVNSNLVT
jgi:hypothetical protein